jgi:ribosomal protein S18 acetylase RimI-like enzyme
VSLNIRPATEADWSIVERLFPVYIGELPIGSDIDLAELMLWVRRQFDLALKGERYFWLAYDGEQFVGFTMFAVFENPIALSKKSGLLMDFYIVPEMRRQRWGHELAERAFHAMQQAGAGSVELDVLRDNQRGLAFWQNLGLETQRYRMKLPLANDTKG